MKEADDVALERPLYEDFPARIVPWGRILLLAGAGLGMVGFVIAIVALVVSVFFKGPLAGMGPQRVTVGEVLSVGTETDADGTSYPEITYRFAVSGEMYEGDGRIGPEIHLSGGDKVRVQYDPVFPQMNLLYQTMGRRMVVFAYLVLFYSLAAFALIFLMPSGPRMWKVHAPTITREGTELTAIWHRSYCWVSPGIWGGLLAIMLALPWYALAGDKRPAYLLAEDHWYDLVMPLAAVVGLYIVGFVAMRLLGRWLIGRGYWHSDPALVLNVEARTLTTGRYAPATGRLKRRKTWALEEGDRLVVLVETEGCARWLSRAIRSGCLPAVLRSRENRAFALPVLEFMCERSELVLRAVEEFNRALGKGEGPSVFVRRVFPLHLMQRVVSPLKAPWLDCGMRFAGALTAVPFGVLFVALMTQQMPDIVSTIASGQPMDALGHIGAALASCGMVLVGLAWAVNLIHHLVLRQRWPHAEQGFPFRVGSYRDMRRLSEAPETAARR